MLRGRSGSDGGGPVSHPGVTSARGRWSKPASSMTFHLYSPAIWLDWDGRPGCHRESIRIRQARRRALTERPEVSAPRTVDAPAGSGEGWAGRRRARSVLARPSLRSPTGLCARLCAALLSQPSPSLRSRARPCATQPVLSQPSPSLRNPSPPCLLARPPLRSAGSPFAGSTGPRYRVVTESSDRADGVDGCGAVGPVCLAGIAQRITPREVVPGGPRRSGSSGPLRCRE